MTKVNDNGVDREMTKDELIAFEKLQQQILLEKENHAADLDAKNAIRTNALSKLGLTADEIAALFS